MKGSLSRVVSLRRVVAVAFAVAAVIAAVVVRSRIPVDVETAEVDRGTVVDEVLGVGTVESDMEVRTAFAATGRLVALTVDEGDEVRRGQPLGTIDLAVSTTEVDTARAGAAIQRALADRDKARTALATATRERARLESLYASGAVTASERDAAIDGETLARSDLAAREAALAESVAAREVAKRTTLSREARAADSLLTSPLDGLVVRRHVEPGYVVTAGMPVLTLAALSEMRIRAWVDETALARLAVGQAARVVFRSEPDREYRATVTRIGRSVDRQTHELLVDLRLAEAPTSLSLGQRADAWIALERRPDAVRVPRGFCDERAKTCLVARGGRAARVPVSFGLIGRTDIEVLGGLDAGERLVRPLELGADVVGRRVRSVPAR